MRTPFAGCQLLACPADFWKECPGEGLTKILKCLYFESRNDEHVRQQHPGQRELAKPGKAGVIAHCSRFCFKSSG